MAKQIAKTLEEAQELWPKIPLGMVKDQTNKRFGKLTALYRTLDKNKHKQWVLKCDCGNYVNITTYGFTSGRTISCGCYAKEVASHIKFQDLTGQRFGKLTVKSFDKFVNNNFGTRQAYWLCQCDCDPEGKHLISVITCNLKSGHTVSCGCIKSNGEYKISKILNQNNILFYKGYCFKNAQFSQTQGNMIFDFFVNNSYIIEYDGIQHYQEVPYFKKGLDYVQQHDKEKNQWCKDNNIPLIRIPYWHLNDLKIEDLLLETSEYII